MPEERCEHFDQISNAAPRAKVCEKCAALGEPWVALRVCLSCGHVGCCEDSPHAHALAHFQATGHPIIRPLESPKSWTWCYPHNRYFKGLGSTAANEGYDPLAKVLHWLVFALVFAQFVVAFAMPPPRRGVPPAALNSLHVSIGMTILAVIVVRWLWRLRHPVAPAAGAFAWEQAAARVTHVLLYAIIVVVPFLGWANASARNWPIKLYGLPLPQLVAVQSSIGRLAGRFHVLLAWALLALIALHVAVAVYHAIVRRDGMLQRMLPREG